MAGMASYSEYGRGAFGSGRDCTWCVRACSRRTGEVRVESQERSGEVRMGQDGRLGGECTDEVWSDAGWSGE